MDCCNRAWNTDTTNYVASLNKVKFTVTHKVARGVLDTIYLVIFLTTTDSLHTILQHYR